MKVAVQTVSGEIVHVVIRENDTVEKFVEKLFKKSGIRVEPDRGSWRTSRWMACSSRP
jgi:hypothetical protein